MDDGQWAAAVALTPPFLTDPLLLAGLYSRLGLASGMAAAARRRPGEAGGYGLETQAMEQLVELQCGLDEAVAGV